MQNKLSLSQQTGIAHVFAVIIGLGLLAGLIFSLNALFASHTQQPSQSARKQEVETQSNEDIAERPSPSPTVATGQADPTANWETYRNEQHRFELKYPPDFFFEESPSAQSVYFLPNRYRELPSRELFSSSVINIETLSYLKASLTPQEWLEEVKKDRSNRGYSNVRNETPKLISGVQAIQFTSTNTQLGADEINTLIYAKDSNTLLMVSLSNPGKGAMVDIYNQVLSTFHFTDQ